MRSPHFDDNLDELAELRSNRTAEIPANFFDDMDGEYDIDSGEDTEDTNLAEVSARPRAEAGTGAEVPNENASTPEN